MNERYDVPMSELGTFQLGGPCRRVISCSTDDEVVAAANALRSHDEEVILIGGGSNLLFSDAGFDGALIQFLSSATLIAQPEPGHFDVPGGVSLDDLVLAAVTAGREGLVCCSGIPGTVGGAIVGNAGAWGEQIGDCLHSVELLDRSGQRQWVPAAELGFAYRHSRLREDTDLLLLSARFELAEGDLDALRSRRAEILALRKEKHPNLQTHPCIGSIFRNIEPTSAAGRRQAAGWFLEQAGGRELKVGGARIFDKHANIIVKGQGCTAQDVHDLTLKMQALVRAHSNLELRREVRFLGPFAGAEPCPGFF